jgi:flagellum-specific ATP synthase
MRGAYLATAVAEYFCKQGKKVLLMMDSVTRFAMAQREIGLSIGEPPATKGYTPSVFAMLPKLLERAGSFDTGGSITGLYTVLVEGDDMDDPIADSVRSIVDGHIVLSRSLAQKGHYPAIDIMQSTSRVMRNVTDPAHYELAMRFRELMAHYKEAEDLINIGAYKKGSNAKVDRAIDLHDRIEDFLKQEIGTKFDMDETIMTMHDILRT